MSFVAIVALLCSPGKIAGARYRVVRKWLAVLQDKM